MLEIVYINCYQLYTYYPTYIVTKFLIDILQGDFYSDSIY